MGKHDGKVTIGTELDKSGVKKGIGTLGKDLSGSTQSVGKGIGKVSGALGGLSGVLKKVGGVIAAAFSVSAVVNFGKEAIQLGSDLQEVQNVVDVVFPTMTQQINDFARNAVHTAGMSETMAKKYAGTFGAMANSFKFTESQAAGMSTTLTQLAGDVTSFYNITQDEAFTKLSAVFTGETEALKHLGVVMTETALNEFAMQKGMDKTVQKMTEQEKVALRYKFVLEQLSAASGDFVRTSDSWANQTRLLKVQFDQLKATIGQGLINALTPVIKVINAVIAKLQVLAAAFRTITAQLFGDASGGSGSAAAGVSELAESYESAAAGAGSLADETAAAGKAADKYLAGFDELKKLEAPDSGSGSGSGGTGGSGADTDLGDLSLGIGGSGTGGVVGEISATLQAVIDKIQELIQPLKEIDLSPLKESLTNLGKEFLQFGTVISDSLEWVWFNILVPLGEWTIEEALPAQLDAVAAALSALSAAAEPVAKGLAAMWDELQPLVEFTEDTALLVLGALKTAFKQIAVIFEKDGDKIVETLHNLGIVISELHYILEPFLELLNLTLFVLPLGPIVAELDLLIDRLHGLSQLLAGLATGDLLLMWDGLSSTVETELSAIGVYFESFAKLLGLDVEQLRNDIEEFFGPLAEWVDKNVIQPITEAFEPEIQYLTDLLGRFKLEAENLFQAINLAAQWCTKKIKEFWRDIPGWLYQNVIVPMASEFSDFFGGIVLGAWNFGADAVATFEYVKNWIKTNFVDKISEETEKLWNGMELGARSAITGIQSIFSSIGSFFRNILNGVIRILNTGLRNTFNKINSLLSGLRSINVAGVAPFSGIRTISVPQIPYLAQGAVLPPNKPFLAMVGDQRHGTNVEAPLATIQEAVALVMQDQTAAIMAGFNASVGVQREILEAVLGIRIGDTEIAQAVDRYRSKMTVVRGGVL